MRWLNALGFRRLAWSLRRLHCPVPASALVLEVGSGGNPTEPDKFLGELQRVARAGYIETPDAFMERINPYKDHRPEVTVRDGRLKLRKKDGWLGDAELVELYEHRAKRDVTRDLMPGVRNSTSASTGSTRSRSTSSIRPRTPMGCPNRARRRPLRRDCADCAPRCGKRGSGAVRALFSQRARNSQIDLLPLLRCPSFGNTHLVRAGTDVECGSRYPCKNGVLLMNAAGPPHAG